METRFFDLLDYFIFPTNLYAITDFREKEKKPLSPRSDQSKFIEYFHDQTLKKISTCYLLGILLVPTCIDAVKKKKFNSENKFHLKRSHILSQMIKLYKQNSI